jgi:hypothetical protein
MTVSGNPATPQGYYAAGVTPVELRQTDETTGGQKGAKLAQLGALDPKALYTVAEVAGFGANKYAAFNFLRGYSWALNYDAMQRHLMQWWAGEDNDSESGLPHLAHAAWHCLALLAFVIRGRGTDDRPQAVLDAAILEMEQEAAALAAAQAEEDPFNV